MSSTVIFWVVLVTATAVSGFFAWMARYRRKGRRNKHRELLRGSTTAQLLSDINKALDHLAWDRFSAVARIRALGPAAKDTDLLDALKSLWKEACDEDTAQNRSGRDSNEFQLYDSGIVAIMEVVEEKVVRLSTL